MNLKNQLGLLFEGYQIRYQTNEGKPWFVAMDVCRAMDIQWSRKVTIAPLPDSWVTTLDVTLESQASHTQRKTRSRLTHRMVCISEAGVFKLAFRSRKPEADRFVDWLAAEVLPQLLKYGVFVEGATPAERCRLLYRRYRAERESESKLGDAELAGSGLMTIAAFRATRDLPLP